MQMSKHGSVKNVPDELVEFMQTRGWEPATAAPPAATPDPPAETSDNEPVEDFVVWDDPEDENDVVDPDDADSTIDPAEEQS